MTEPNKPKPNTNLNVTHLQAETKIDSAGRVLFPAWLRKSAGVDIGERVIIELNDGILTISKADDGTEVFNGNDLNQT